MKYFLTKRSHFKRAYTSTKDMHSVAKLERSTFVLIAILVLANVVSADVNASRVGTAVITATKSMSPTESHREADGQMSIAVGELNAVPAHQGDGIVTVNTSAEALSVQQSQHIIANLSETVESLSQQLSVKDQQIERLEKQIVELENYSDGDIPAESQTTPLWHWVLLFIALSPSVYLIRARFHTLWQSLKIFRSNNHVEFNGVAEQRPADVSTNRAAQRSASGKEILESVPCHDIAHDNSHEANDALGVEANAVIDDLSFDQRFEKLLAEKDFAFARELLDFTRYNEINDERYHCKRLRLLEEMQDEDGFYEYYYGIEPKIPTFSENLQTQISQLVVMLAQR